MKALPPIDLTARGVVKEVRLAHPSKASSPMLSMVLGSRTSRRLPQPEIDKSTFKDAVKQGLVKLSVPKGCMSIYKADKAWAQFTHMSEISLIELQNSMRY